MRPGWLLVSLIAAPSVLRAPAATAQETETPAASHDTSTAAFPSDPPQAVAESQQTVADAHRSEQPQTVAGSRSSGQSQASSESQTAYAGSVDKPPEPVGAPLPTKTEWYGGTTLLVDGIGILSTPILVGFGVYAVGAPIVHVSKGEYVRAGASLALRIGLPTLLAVAGQHDCSNASGSEECGASEGIGALIRGIVGGLLAITIDAAALAYRQVPVKLPARAQINYLPNIAVNRESAVIFVSGQF
jgi:hypothetical protein